MSTETPPVLSCPRSPRFYPSKTLRVIRTHYRIARQTCGQIVARIPDMSGGYELRPILFEFGPITIRSYGLALGIALMAGYRLSLAEIRRRIPDLKNPGALICVSAAFSLLSARLFYSGVRLHGRLPDLMSALDFRDGLGALHGGFIGGAAALWFFAAKTKTPYGRLVDCFVPALGVGIAIGRIGCLLAGCCYGRATSVPWAVKSALAAGSRHPSQAYEAILLAVVFLATQKKRQNQRYDGESALLYLGLYSLGRFVVECFREPFLLIGPFSLAQLLSLLLGVVAFCVHRHKLRALKRESGGGPL